VPSLIVSRLLAGLVVLICAEVFSGASLGAGLWNPFTVIVTYPLYFLHFFVCTTLAARTGRTSLGALYLWGVLFGLYESWITKVLWAGYEGNRVFVIGSVGPYGLSELTMVLLYHPVASFILPLTVMTVLAPGLRATFPDLALFTGTTRAGRAIRLVCMACFGTVMGFNSLGAMNLVLNLALALALFALARAEARPVLGSADPRSVAVLGPRGLAAAVLGLVVLYGVGYRWIRYDALPSVAVQAATFAFYAVAIGGLTLFRRRTPEAAVTADARAEWRRVRGAFLVIVALAVTLSLVPRALVLVAMLAILWSWVLGSAALLSAALAAGIRERLSTLAAAHARAG
jgi:hypothetical protein